MKKQPLLPTDQIHQPIPADVDLHLMDIAQITADAFAGGKYVKEISETYIGNCHYDFDVSRLIYDKTELIHHWGVWGYPMRLGSVQLKVAGIGAVVTREPYREQGLMTMAANDSFKGMYEHGYDLSVLRGRHYVKFGFARAWNYVTTKLGAEEIPDFELKHPYEQLKQKHLKSCVTLYNHNYQAFTGTAVRPTYQHLSDDSGYYGWFDGDVLTGYVRSVPTEDGKALQCLEAVGDPEQGLAVLKGLYEQGNYENLNFFTIPQQHPILQIVRRGACVVEDRYFYNTGWRVKIINLISVLEKMMPLLEARLRMSHLLQWKGKIHLDGGDQSLNLEIDAGKIRIVEPALGEHSLLAGPALARFIIGSDHPAEIIQQEGIICNGNAAELVNVLFPNLNPMMSHFDEY